LPPGIPTGDRIAKVWNLNVMPTKCCMSFYWRVINSVPQKDKFYTNAWKRKKRLEDSTPRWVVSAGKVHTPRFLDESDTGR
jgi:hypothetical protein